MGRYRSKRLSLAVRDRDNWRCVKCFSRLDLECHHIVPVKEGGRDAMDNCLTLCRDCHLKLHSPMARARREWLEYSRCL